MPTEHEFDIFPASISLPNSPQSASQASALSLRTTYITVVPCQFYTWPSSEESWLEA